MTDLANLYTEITQDDLGYARGRALKRAQNRLMVTRFGLVDPQPLNSTRTRMWIRWNRPAIPQGPISEGINGPGSKVTSSVITAQLEQFSDHLPFTDRMLNSSKEQIIKIYSELAGEQAAITLETNDLAVLKAGTNVVYAGTSATGRTTVTSPPTTGNLRVLVRSLINQGATKVTKMIKASSLISTVPIEPAFIAFVHPDMASDIRDMRGYINPKEYPSGDAFPGEIGTVEEVRFLGHDLLLPYLSAATNAASQTTFLTGGVQGTGSADVYPVLIFGNEAYATVPLANQTNRRGEMSDTSAIKINVVMPKPQHGDEAGLNGFVSWLVDHTCGILNQGWLKRWEVACTAAPSN